MNAGGRLEARGDSSDWEIGYLISAEELWEKIRGGTNKLYSEKGSWVVAGPELGNLGGAPELSFINGHLTLRLPISYQSIGLYNTTPDEELRKRISAIAEDLEVDGVNIYWVTDGGRERIAFKDNASNFIYDPSETVVSAEDLANHLELAAQLYSAFAAACYEVRGLEAPQDTLVIRGDELVRAESSKNRVDRELLEAAGDMLVSVKPDITFEDIGGQEKAVAICRRFAEQLRYPEVFALEGSVPPRGILLWGPPGTGKTLLAKAIAHEAETHFLHVKAGDIAGEGLYGQSENETENIFRLAGDLIEQEDKRVVIYLDEGDYLLPSNRNGYRHESTAKTVGIFAQAIDGFSSEKKMTVIISTNDPEDIDPKILSRMEEMMEVPLPTAEGLQRIMQIHLDKLSRITGRDMLGEIDIEKVGRKAFERQMSGRDMADVVAELARSRGQLQLQKLRETIGNGTLPLPRGTEEAEYIRMLAMKIANGEMAELEQMVLAPARTEDILRIVDQTKTLLKPKKTGSLGFVRQVNGIE